MKLLKLLLLFLAIALLATPALQSLYPAVKEPPLKGYFRQDTVPPLKYFTWQRWFGHEFQDAVTAGLNDQAGFRNTLVRIHNQADWSLFGITHAQGFISGKDRWLFEEDYIHEYKGSYFIGTKPLDRMVSRLKNVRDSLAAHGIPLVFVLESGKARICPEYIPARYHPETRTQNNYDYVLKRAQEAGLPLLDLNAFLLKVRDTATWPLFPRYGMHWSLYGTHLVADTLARYITATTGRPMPAFRGAKMQPTVNSPGTDYDIAELLNLLLPLPATPGVEPLVPFGRMPDGALPALVVGDSYYVQLVETYGRKMFGRQEFWYYNNSLYPHQNEVPPVRADKSNLRDRLESFRAVLVMVSEINMHCCLWNFADEAYRAFHPEVMDSQLDALENTIRIDREWFRFMVKKARDQGVTLEEAIRGDAEYSFLSRFADTPGKNRMDSIQFLRLKIKNDAEWLANVTKKAKDLNIPVDTMMLLDAIYSYDQSKKNH